MPIAQKLKELNELCYYGNQIKQEEEARGNKEGVGYIKEDVCDRTMPDV